MIFYSHASFIDYIRIGGQISISIRKSLLVFETGPTNLFCCILVPEDVDIQVSWIVKANALSTNPMTYFVLSLATMEIELLVF